MYNRQAGFLPGVHAADLDLAVVSGFLQDGCRTGSPASAPSIDDQRFTFWHLVEPRFELVDRDVVVALDRTLFFQLSRIVAMSFCEPRS